jgi:hypothetical protein
MDGSVAETSLPMLLRQDAQCLLELLSNKRSNVLRDLSPRKEFQLGVALCFVCSDRDIDELLQLRTIGSLNDHSRGISSSTEQSRLSCCGILRQMLGVEDRICSVWESFGAIYPGPGGTAKMRSLLPVLRLPYNNISTPTQDLDWFASSAAIYKSASTELDQILNSSLTAALQIPFEAELKVESKVKQITPVKKNAVSGGSANQGRSNQSESSADQNVYRPKANSTPVKLVSSKIKSDVHRRTDPGMTTAGQVENFDTARRTGSGMTLYIYICYIPHFFIPSQLFCKS